MSGPNTAREALIAELLGDAGQLADRMDKLKEEIPAVVKAAEDRITRAGVGSAVQVSQAAKAASDQITRQIAVLTADLSNHVERITSAGEALASSSRHALLTALALGLVGGGVAGALVALALIH